MMDNTAVELYAGPTFVTDGRSWWVHKKVNTNSWLIYIFSFLSTHRVHKSPLPPTLVLQLVHNRRQHLPS